MSEIVFVTNRNPNRKRDPDDFGGGFHPDAPDNLRFGRAEVAGDAVRSIEVASERLNEDRGKARLGSRQIFDQLARAMRAGAHTLCFLHGFNVSFRESLVAGHRLHERYATAAGLNVVVFSWPSDGSMLPLLAYKSDRTDAAVSGAALSRALLKLRDFLAGIRRGDDHCNARLHLLAHSMGNYVLRHGLQAFARESQSLPRLFDEIFMMAADEDHDAFEHEYKLARLPDLAQSVNVYFNRGDTALVVSDRTKQNPARLGSRGPRAPHAVPGNVTLIDASGVVEGLVEHSYFWRNDRVVADVREVMAAQPPELIAGRRYVASQNRYVLE